MQLYWQAKIWGLLHDPIFKALYDNNGRGGTGWWRQLPAMRDWMDLPADQYQKLVDYVTIADQISSASDRGAIGNLEIIFALAPTFAGYLLMSIWFSLPILLGTREQV